MKEELSYRLGRSAFRTFYEGIEKEWLLTNGIGGFANSTIIGASSRVFSGYLIAALNPPIDRMLVFAKTHEVLVIEGEEYDFAAQEYPGQIREGQKYLTAFTLDILPIYTYQAGDITVKKTVTIKHGENAASVCYEISGGRKEAVLHITPLFTYRPFDTVSEKSDVGFQMDLSKAGDSTLLTLIPQGDDSVRIEFYASEGEFFDRSLKPVSMATPNYLIDENEVFVIDQRTGFTGVDHMATPYDVCVTINPFEQKKLYVNCSLVSVSEDAPVKTPSAVSFDGFAAADEYKERMCGYINRISYEDVFAKRLAWAADAFIVHRESTGLKTILAGLPWFSDWGRDTMIALTGLTMVTGRLEDAKDILASFSRYVKNGMIPNVFPAKSTGKPGYNTIDASLWYFYAVDKFLAYALKNQGILPAAEAVQFIEEDIYPCLLEIINYYKKGTAYGICMDTDGLIMGGSDLDQLTWMDVRVGDVVVTPRHGKPVEINALWYNALKVMEKLTYQYAEKEKDIQKKEQLKQRASEYEIMSEQTKKSFAGKFWNAEKECLYDVITKEIPDASIRPNQIYAVSLPFTMLSKEQEKKVVETVYEKLYTPYGLRSLEPADVRFKAEYTGKLLKRDMAYHMGTAWGYLSGAFITAYCKVNDYSKEAVAKAEEMCLCFQDHMQDGCLNGIAEIFDGGFACTGRGCYSQGWSVGEVLRAYTEDVLSRK